MKKILQLSVCVFLTLGLLSCAKSNRGNNGLSSLGLSFGDVHAIPSCAGVGSSGNTQLGVYGDNTSDLQHFKNRLTANNAPFGAGQVGAEFHYQVFILRPEATGVGPGAPTNRVCSSFEDCYVTSGRFNRSLGSQGNIMTNQLTRDRRWQSPQEILNTLRQEVQYTTGGQNGLYFYDQGKNIHYFCARGIQYGVNFGAPLFANPVFYRDINGKGYFIRQ